MTANFGLLLASLTFIYAVKTTTAANASFLGSITPLVAVVLARFVLGERLSRVTLGAIVVAFVGLIVTVFGDLHAGNMIGNIAALMASVGFAIYTISVRSDPDADWSPVLPGYAAMMIVLCSVITLAHGKTLFPPAGEIGLGSGARCGVHRRRHHAVQPRVEASAGGSDDRSSPRPRWCSFHCGSSWCWVKHPRPATIVGGAIIFAAVVGKAILDTSPGAVQPVQEY